MNLTCNMCLKIALLKLLPHFWKAKHKHFYLSPHQVEVSTRGQWPGSPQTSPGLSPRTDTPGLGGSTPAAGSVGLRDIMALEEKMARAVQITPQIRWGLSGTMFDGIEFSSEILLTVVVDGVCLMDDFLHFSSKKMTRVSQKERKRQQQAALEAERRVAEQQPEQQATKKDSPRENPWLVVASCAPL